LSLTVLLADGGLPNSYVIHVRAASYINDDAPEECLDRAVRSVLAAARDAGIQTLAMPAIGTGVFKFPPALAAEIIVNALRAASCTNPSISLVRICLADDQVRSIFEQQLRLTDSNPR
jgi:O-acetyl-ADP-ribose deacetylase (regulator of RNase III)